MAGYATDKNQNGDSSSTINMLPVFYFYFLSSQEMWLEEKNSCWI